MAEQRGSFGKIVLWVVLGVVGVILAWNVIMWAVGVLLKVVLATLIIGAVAGAGFLLIRAARRSVTGGNGRRQLPR